LIPESPNTSPKDTTAISSAMTFIINEEKEKCKRTLDLIIYNLEESSKENGDARKQEDTSLISNILEKHIGVSLKIDKAFRLGLRRDKPQKLRPTLNKKRLQFLGIVQSYITVAILVTLKSYL